MHAIIMKTKLLLPVLGIFLIAFSVSCSKSSYNDLGANVFKEWRLPISVRNENPGPVGRTETGRLNIQLHADSSLRFDFTVDSLMSGDSLTGAGIHAGDPVSNGAVVLDLHPRFINNYGSGIIYDLRPSLVDSLLNPNVELYFNLYSNRVPTGLVRAQLNRVIVMQGSATLTGAQVVPPVTTTASGSVLLRLTEDRRLYSRIEVANVEPNEALTAAHLHQGAPGVNGPILATLANATADYGVSRMTTVDSATAAIIMTDRIYVDVHSSAAANGKLRGQVRN
ncbi:MAG: hypothetical protein JWQ96_478 [Segetibacter sp.]|nr:hypothetical protein [Segetibacter sp.]